MIKFFNYDSKTNSVTVNEPEILLVKEFADLWTNEYNKCSEDPKGTQKIKGFKALTYIYLAIDWGAPGSKDTPLNRHLMAMQAAGFTDKDFNADHTPKDPILFEACKKYRELQDSSSVVGKMVETYTNKLHEMRIFIESIDFNERSETTGAPVFKTRDMLNEMQILSKALDSLKDLEARYKAEKEEASGYRGGVRPGLLTKEKL